MQRHVDILAFEVLAEAAQRARTAYSGLTSFDWNAYQLATAKLTAEERGLVVAAHNLAMGSAARRLQHQGVGTGTCPFCGAADSRVVHEAWTCKAFKEQQEAEDVSTLAGLGPRSWRSTSS